MYRKKQQFHSTWTCSPMRRNVGMTTQGFIRTECYRAVPYTVDHFRHKHIWYNNTWYMSTQNQSTRHKWTLATDQNLLQCLLWDRWVAPGLLLSIIQKIQQKRSKVKCSSSYFEAGNLVRLLLPFCHYICISAEYYINRHLIKNGICYLYSAAADGDDSLSMRIHL